VIITIDGGDNAYLTSQTIYSSASPVFNRRWCLIVPYYRAILRIFLVDAITNRKVRYIYLSIYLSNISSIYLSNQSSISSI
jgi:hypothetical protein